MYFDDLSAIYLSTTIYFGQISFGWKNRTYVRFFILQCFYARILDGTDKNDGYVVDGFEISYIGNPFC